MEFRKIGLFLNPSKAACFDVACELKDILQEYEVDEATARRSVEVFVGKLKENGFIAE